MGLRIRVEAKLRTDFVDACRSEGKPAAQVLREFMRAYVEARRADQQGDLFNLGAIVPPRPPA